MIQHLAVLRKRFPAKKNKKALTMRKQPPTMASKLPLISLVLNFVQLGLMSTLVWLLLNHGC